jgi:hypothetical protein
MKIDFTILLEELVKTRGSAKTKNTEFVDAVLAQHYIKKEREERKVERENRSDLKSDRDKRNEEILKQKLEAKINGKPEKIIDRIYNLAKDYKTFNIGEAAEAVGASWGTSYHAIKQLAKEGKLKEAAKQETGKRGKKSVIWSIANGEKEKGKTSN